MVIQYFEILNSITEFFLFQILVVVTFLSPWILNLKILVVVIFEANHRITGGTPATPWTGCPTRTPVLVLFLRFLFLRIRFSCGKWQNKQAAPFWQRPFSWKQQRLQVPLKWPAEPIEGRSPRPIKLSSKFGSPTGPEGKQTYFVFNTDKNWY